MNLEIIWNDEYFYINNMGNFQQGCLNVLRDWVQDNPNENVPISNFVVTNLSSDYSTEQTIGLAEILAIQILAVNDEFIDELESVTI